eukprot:478669-Prorocentrum_minimum.AAC.1
MKSWRFLVLNYGVRRGSGGVLRGSDVRSRGRIYRFDSRDNMRHDYHSVRHRPSSCPSDLRSGGLKKSGNARKRFSGFARFQSGIASQTLFYSPCPPCQGPKIQKRKKPK